MNNDDNYYTNLNLTKIDDVEKDYKYFNLLVNNNDLLSVQEINDTTNKDNDTQSNVIPISLLLAYCLPSFGKMSCIVLLNVNSTIFYESIGANLNYMSFWLAFCLLWNFCQ